MTSDKSRSNSPDGADEPGESGAPSRTVIACDRCRRSKLRCSRDRPACTHCTKIGNECRYETQRMKPGVRVGAIDNIYRRLEKLEDEASQRRRNGSTSSDYEAPSCERPESAAHDVLALLAKELPRLLGPNDNSRTQDTRNRPYKRPRTENWSSSGPRDQGPPHHEHSPPLPSTPCIQALVDVYFARIHPWIPMLHQDRFRRRAQNIATFPETRIILQAIVIAASRYLGEETCYLLPEGDAHWPHDRIRDWIVREGLAQVTLEGLQALVILVFNDIGCGSGTMAWSLVASLSRTVQFSQLTTDEFDDSQSQPICQPYSCLAPAQDWAEREERRRVFWNVFLLDRFCSTTMGWNACLTSIDVHQRLPCDGFLWRREEGGLTPYLGIWDRSNGGMDHRTSSGHPAESASALDSDVWAKDSSLHMSPGQGEVDMSKVGAFGYCVEAFESMSRVTSYFLQQRVNLHDPAEVKTWLDRFRELDMRLVHWRLFVPRKWTSTTNDPLTRKMDPNLTLAHITHNTSTILLHQVIAYPPPHWPFWKKLPSTWSAETCSLAAIEISTITQKYLGGTAGDLAIVSHAFAFCVYIAARVLIVHWRYMVENELLEEFWSLMESLEDMSRRWRGRKPAASIEGAPQPTTDLAARYHQQLRTLYGRCAEDESYRINVAAYTLEFHQQDMPVLNGGMPPPHNANHQTRTTSQVPPIPNGSLPQHYVYGGRGGHGGPASLQTQMVPEMEPLMRAVDTLQMPTPSNAMPTGLTPTLDTPTMFHATMDQYYMDMDRVIAFNDGSLFSADHVNL